MRYGQIREYDIANGKGIRCSIFVTGCTRNCKNCFNKEYKDFNAGKLWTDKETQLIINYLSEDVVDGLTILGGEPFENSEGLVEIIKEIKKSTKKNIWIYSGYTYDQIISDNKKKELLMLCDILVDGPFIEELKDLRLKFRGSSNQRIIDIQKTLKSDHIIEYMD